MAVLAAAAGLSTFGIIDLVARGYGTLAWGFIALVVVPLFVVVPYRSLRATELSSLGTRLCNSSSGYTEGL